VPAGTLAKTPLAFASVVTSAEFGWFGVQFDLPPCRTATITLSAFSDVANLRGIGSAAEPIGLGLDLFTTAGVVGEIFSRISFV
jgi:hypothetical protein